MQIDSLPHQESQNVDKSSLKTKIVQALDLFSFLPVPRTDPVSTYRSVFGSLLMFILFLVYIIFNFVGFIINNAPRANVYRQLMNPENITLPNMAFAFFLGEPFTETINDPRMFTLSMQQVYKYRNVSKSDKKVEIPLEFCKPPWFPDQGFDMLCPTISSNMSGALYQTDIFAYSRIVINYCDQKKRSDCVSNDNLSKITAGLIQSKLCNRGRLLLFMENNDPDFDMTTGKKIEAVPYNAFQYFLMPGLYPRAEMYFFKSTYTIFPDFFRRFKKQKKNFLTIDNVNEWITNVSIYSTTNAFQIYFRMNLQETVAQLVYSTFLDQIAKWGAFWGVLFAGFAAYFLKYNESRFYQKNNQWENFETSIGVARLSSTSMNSNLTDSGIRASIELGETNKEQEESKNNKNKVHEVQDESL